jgi:2-dehydro-3-deoxygluconokinase
MAVYDLLTVGEAMIRFSVPAGQLLVAAPTFDVNIAGAESNVAVAVAHMGYRARWLSRLTDNVMGRRIVNTLTGNGVDCSGVAWTSEDRVGTYFLEFGAMPRPTQVTYDRANSAASKMGPATFDLAQVAETRILHLTGITPALSESCYALIVELLNRAKQHKVHVVFDINYRAKLWKPDVCAQKLGPLLDRVDTLLMSRADAQTVFNIQGDPETIISALQDRFHVPQIALTLSEAGAIGLENGIVHHAEGYRVQMIDRIGAGDAFAAGVICGILRDDFALGLRYGVAMSALQLTLSGDIFQLSEADVIRLIESGTVERPIR